MAELPTTQPAVGSMQYDIANGLAPGTSSSGDFKAPSLTTPTAPITSASIQKADPVTLPETANTSANAASSAMGTMAGINDNIQADLKAETDMLKANVSAQRTAVDRNIAQLGNRGADQSAAETAAGIPALRSTAQTLAQEYNTKLLAYNAQYKAISKDASMSADQRARQLAAVTNEHSYDQTNLAIRSTIANGDYTAAQALVDKQIDIKYGGLKDLIGYQTALLASDKADLSDKQKTSLQIKLDENKRKLDEVTYQAHATQETKNDLLKSASIQGAPESLKAAIQNAKDSTAAIAAAGPYAGDILDREIKRKQLEKTNAEIRKLNRESDGLTISPVNNPNAAKYKDALNIILGSEKFTKEQKASITNAVNMGQDPFQVIKNNAKNIMGQTLATDLDKAETAKTQLIAIDKSLKDFYAAGGKTGIFSGNYEKVLNKLGEVKDPKVVGLATEIALAMQAYRLAVTGTAASVQEDARIDNVFPGITSGKMLNNARTQATIKSFDTKIDSSYRNTLGSTYDDLKKAEKSVTPEPVPADANPWTGMLNTIFNPQQGYIIPQN